MRTLILVAGIHTGWLVTVLGASMGRPWAGLVVIIGILIGHFVFSAKRRALFMLIVTMGAVGFVADSVLVLSGLLGFPANAVLGGPTSIWMVALWMNLAPVLPKLCWFHGRWGLAGAVGLAAGPVAYAAGKGVGAVTFPGGDALALSGIGLEWAAATPAMLWLSHRLFTNAIDEPGGAA